MPPEPDDSSDEPAALSKFIVPAVVLILIVGVCAWSFSRPAYHRYKVRSALRVAQVSMKERQFKKAWLSATVVLRMEPTNFEACTLMADLADMEHSPAAVVWRKKVAELKPTPENRLAFASCALKYERPPFPQASQALDSLQELTNSARFHGVLAERALRLGQTTEAEQHYREAHRLEPSNGLHRVNLAVLQLVRGSPQTAAQGRSELKNLVSDPQHGVVAARSLRADSLNQKDWQGAFAYSTGILSQAGCAFEDRIQHLSLLAERDARATRGTPVESAAVTNSLFEDFDRFLRMMENTSDAGEVTALATWLNVNNRAAETTRWLNTLPVSLRTTQPLPILMADACRILKDWRGMELCLRDRQWGDQEYIRLAMRSRMYRAQGEAELANSHWTRALRTAAERPDLLYGLVSATEAWGWSKEAEETLWEAATRFPKERWPFHVLAVRYGSQGDTRQVLKTYAALLEVFPDDLVAKNNVASLCMLLNTNLTQAHSLAQEIYTSRPTDPQIACTYAFSLHLQGKTAEGLSLLSALGADDLRKPSVAPYYAAILKAAGRSEEAKPFAALAARAALLPEERALCR